MDYWLYQSSCSFFSFSQCLHGASIPLSYMVGLIVLWFVHAYFLSLFLVASQDRALFICSSHRFLHCCILEKSFSHACR